MVATVDVNSVSVRKQGQLSASTPTNVYGEMLGLPFEFIVVNGCNTFLLP
jgi:hypothetical protein